MNPVIRGASGRDKVIFVGDVGPREVLKVRAALPGRA